MKGNLQWVPFNADNAMKSHVIVTVKACFSALRQTRSVWRSLPQHALPTLVRALVVSKVDYCNSVLAGIFDPERRYSCGFLYEKVRDHYSTAS